MNKDMLIEDFCRPKIGDKILIKQNNVVKIVSYVELIDDTFIIYTEDGFSYVEYQLINQRVVSMISDLLYIPKPEEISYKYGIQFEDKRNLNVQKKQSSYYLLGKIGQIWIKLKKLIT